MREKEQLMHIDRRCGQDVLDVDPFMNGDGFFGRHTVSHQHRADRIGRRDEAVYLPVFPPREGIAFEMEIHPT